MATIYCNLNQCNASVQYFTQYAVNETHNIKNTFTLAFICKNRCHSTMRQCLRQESFVARHMKIVAPQGHYVVQRKILAIR